MQNVLVRPQTTVIQLQGSVNAVNATQVQSDLKTAILATEGPKVLVDMEQVELMDSAGLMALVSTLKLAQHLHKEFRLCAVSQPVRMILELTQLDRVFEINEDQAA